MVLYRMRVDCLSRYLPNECGNWIIVFRRFNLWFKKVFYLIYSIGYQVINILNGYLLIVVLYEFTNKERML